VSRGDFHHRCIQLPGIPATGAGQMLFNDLTVLADGEATLTENENIPILARFLDKFRQ
jgi:hypothetical protein